MFGKVKRAKAPQAAVSFSDKVRVEDGLPLESDSAWYRAQQQHDNLYLRLAAHAANWRKGFVISTSLTLVMGIGVVLMASQSRVEPVFIQVDKLGRTQVLSVGVNDAAKVDVRVLIEREMREFIENTRTVTSDFSANNKALTKGYSRLPSTAPSYKYVWNDLLGHKPNVVAEKKTIEVDVKLAMPITDGAQRNSWQVEWSETSYDLKGERMGEPEMWKANIQYELHPGKEVTINPVGFYIPTLSWAKLK